MSDEPMETSAETVFAELYATAKTDVVAFDRSTRGRLRVSGRAPGQMLGGVLTGHIPEPLADDEPAPAGMRAYSTILTPKGKMLSDLYVYRMPGPDEVFMLDIPEPGMVEVTTQFAKVLPPRLARCEDGSGVVRLLTLAGPLGSHVTAGLLGLGEEAIAALGIDQVALGNGIVAARSDDLSVPTYDLLVPAAGWSDVRDAVLEHDIPWVGADVWNTLRVEAGTPAFGVDMDESTIPIEAGIGERAFDHTKGCYTGQEVIVRIRHRGHVNRHLHPLSLSGTDSQPGDELFLDGNDKAIGVLTSVVESPERGVLALGYVRREVEVGSVLNVTSPAGDVTATVGQPRSSS